eukprot:11156342-Alexandrium_andersonii.AAC.1
MAHSVPRPRRVFPKALCAFGAVVTLGTWRTPEVNEAACGTFACGPRTEPRGEAAGGSPRRRVSLSDG